MARELRISGHRESLCSSGALRIDRVARFDAAKMHWRIFLAAASVAATAGAANARSVANTIAQGSDGSYFVKDRKFPNSGDESPWQLRCPVK
jgi:hypothetical protein